MKVNRANQRLSEITPNTLIVGVDIAKKTHWARFVDYRGVEHGKAVSISNDESGFNTIVSEIHKFCKSKFLNFEIKKVIVGMEPTGHYWKSLAQYLMKHNFKVVGVNPYHTKKAKELDDNSQTKSDKKDALTIARLVKDGRYFEPYIPEGVYGELRVLVTARTGLVKRKNAVKNSITAVLDEYFPEFTTVFKHPLKGKAAMQVLKDCPFPSYIIEIGAEGVLSVIRKAVKKTVGIKKANELLDTAKRSVGVTYGLSSAKLKLNIAISELEFVEKQLEELEAEMSKQLCETGYAEKLLAIKGIGVVTAASFLGEVGDVTRFQSARQIANLAGYNLVEDSSGQNKSGTAISKRGRKTLRNVLYTMSLSCVAANKEIKGLYNYLKTRAVNPLKKKQALVVIAKKIITIIYTIITKGTTYQPNRVLGAVRREMMAA